MNQNPENGMDDFMEDMADDLASTREEDYSGPEESTDRDPPIKGLALVGGAILVLIIIIVLLFGGGEKASEGDIAAIQTKIDRIGERLTRIEGMESKILELEKQEKALRQSISKVDKSVKSLGKRLGSLTGKFDALRKGLASIALKAEPPRTVRKKPALPSGGQYHMVRAGESLYRIAQKYDMKLEELCRLNRITPKHVISPGEKLLVSKKGK